jgi:hypothetical protein
MAYQTESHICQAFNLSLSQLFHLRKEKKIEFVGSDFLGFVYDEDSVKRAFESLGSPASNTHDTLNAPNTESPFISKGVPANGLYLWINPEVGPHSK